MKSTGGEEGRREKERTKGGEEDWGRREGRRRG